MTVVRSYTFPPRDDPDPLETQRRALDVLCTSRHPLSRRQVQNALFDDFTGLGWTANALVSLRTRGLARLSWRSDHLFAPTAAGIADAGLRQAMRDEEMSA